MIDPPRTAVSQRHTLPWNRLRLPELDTVVVALGLPGSGMLGGNGPGRGEDRQRGQEDAGQGQQEDGGARHVVELPLEHVGSSREPTQLSPSPLRKKDVNCRQMTRASCEKSRKKSEGLSE